jgi:retinol dehydrogenase 12
MDTKWTALVTGATGKIGMAIADELLTRGLAVVVAGRHAQRTAAAMLRLRQAHPGADVRSEVVDLSRKAQIEALAARWRGPIHVVINNASEAPPHRCETPEGLEVQFATNVMGYFWMMMAMGPLLGVSARATRIVNVASYWAGDLDLDDLQFVRRRYSNDAAYRQSKQAERMLTVSFAEQLRRQGTTVNACHPGDVNSRLSNSLGFGGHESPGEGAETPVWLATEPLGGETTGAYFEHRRRVPCAFGADRDAVARLYESCARF